MELYFLVLLIAIMVFALTSGLPGCLRIARCRDCHDLGGRLLWLAV